MKKIKDKSAPKKPMSAFFLYLAKRRPEVKATETPDKKLSHAEVIKVSSLSNLHFILNLLINSFLDADLAMETPQH